MDLRAVSVLQAFHSAQHEEISLRELDRDLERDHVRRKEVNKEKKKKAEPDYLKPL